MYDELIKSLRVCASSGLPDSCLECPRFENGCDTLREDAADAIEDLENKLNLWRQDKISRWIPVTERLPETARDVLVAFRLPIEKIYLITITQRASWSEKRKHDAFYQRGVTHWMEMPEPPKEET